MLEKVKKEELWVRCRKMVKNNYITNEQLSKHYEKEVNFSENGGKAYELMSKRIKECKINFCDYYLKKGKLVGLEETGKIKGIGKGTLESLERILEKKLGKSEEYSEKKTNETVKNKNSSFMINLGRNWKISYKK